MLKNLLFAPIILVMLLSGCGSNETVQTENREAFSNHIETNTVEERKLEGLKNVERKLVNFLVEQLDTTTDSVSLVASELGEGKLSLSIILDLEQNVDEASMQTLQEMMINIIEEEKNVTINQNDIVIVDGNNQPLN